MSKKKMRAFAGAMAVVLAFVPFLSGCAANDAEDNPQAQQELNADEQSRNEAEGSIGETVQYGQVMAMNGSTATVVVGTLANANDGSGSQAFNAGQDEITFDEGDVSIVDESGAELEGRTLSADDVIVMRGTGSGTDFKPTTIEILDVAGAFPRASSSASMPRRRPISRYGERRPALAPVEFEPIMFRCPRAASASRAFGYKAHRRSMACSC